MKMELIDHIGIVVRSIDEYLATYTDTLGMEYLCTEDMPDYQSKVCFLQCGEVMIELLEPYGPCYNMTLLEEKGGGFSHVCYRVKDIEACYHEMQTRGVPLITGIDRGAGNTRVFFAAAGPMGNVLTEFAQPMGPK